MTTIRYLLLGLTFILYCSSQSNAIAAGFQLSQHSVSMEGRAIAGTGVAGDDLGDIFANPASLTLYDKREFQTGISLVRIDNEFNNEGSFQTLLSPAGAVRLPSSGRDDTSETSGLVPHLYYVFPSYEGFRFALAVTSPFGLSTEYDDAWVGRFHALKSELTTVDINPTIAYQINDRASLGFGLSVQYADATLSNALFLGPGAPQGKVKVTGDDIGFGYNLGLMYEFSDASRIGLSLRSKIKQELDGTRTITGTKIADGRVGAKAVLNLPETAYLSGYWPLSGAWGLFASLRWTNWSRNDEIRITFDDGAPDSVTPQQWDDSLMIAVGANYQVNNDWLLRFGVARDETPIPNSTLRTPRNPDTDRTWLALGASLAKSQKTTLDFTGVVLLAGAREINTTTNLVSSAPGAFTDMLVGEYPSSTAWALGLQLQHRF